MSTLPFVWSDVLTNNWCNLRRLSLQNLICTEHELLYFIARHREILESLRLDDVCLLAVPEGVSDSLDSIVQALWILPHITILESFKTNGEFSTCHREHWKSDSSEDFDQESRRHRLHKCDCGRGKFPLHQLIGVTRSKEVTRTTRPFFDKCGNRASDDNDEMRILEGGLICCRARDVESARPRV